MEVAVEKIKGIAQSAQDFVFSQSRSSIRCNNPIDILKRLQRESFSDIMKLRDRQEKVERVLSYYKSSKGSPFQEASTHLRGDIEVSGAVFVMNDVDQHNIDAIEKAGIRTGVQTRFNFETTIREKDTLVTEFVAGIKNEDDVLHSPLSLAKVLYSANIIDWISVVAVPVGARCRDVGVGTNSHQKSLTNYSSWGPPLLDQYNGSAIGVTVKKSNCIASLAQFMSGIQGLADTDEITRCFTTFGQVMCQISRSTKLSLLGIHQMPKSSCQRVNLGPLSMPLGLSRKRNIPEMPLEGNVSTGSIAMMLDSEIDESTRIGGWLEMQRSNPGCLQWSISMSDTPEYDFGWGLSLGGSIQERTKWDHFQAETFLNFNFGKKFKLQPALVYVMDGATQFPTLMLRSSWSL